MKKRVGYLFLLALMAVVVHLVKPQEPPVAMAAGEGGGAGFEAKSSPAPKAPPVSRGKVRDRSKQTGKASETSAPPGSALCVAYGDEGDLLDSNRDPVQGEANRVVSKFSHGKPLGAKVTFVVLLAPDPVHTNLSLLFDRTMATVQQAGQDGGYDFDSNWLPWRKDNNSELNRLPDRILAEGYSEERNACPGVLLFRKRESATEPVSDAYENGLMVFVVGEQPTGGVNLDQWRNAIKQIKTNPMFAIKNADPDKKPQAYAGPLRVIGPSFSGSFASLKQALTETIHDFPQALLLSGSTTNGDEVKDFQEQLVSLQKSRTGARFAFGVTQESDSVHLGRFLNFLAGEGRCQSSVAILSEDETGYASGSPMGAIKGSNIASCSGANVPETLYYPRDISMVRSAYEKQSVFDSNMLSGHTARPILRTQSDAPANEGLDTLQTYSGDLNAVDEEARLYGILDALRVHHIQYLVLRSTNPVDLLFLSRFFHRTYPEARIVTMGNDLLFRREIDTTEFRGIMSLSTYPLLAREAHWKTKSDNFSLANGYEHHAVYASGNAEGEYMAARLLFDERTMSSWRGRGVDTQAPEALSFEEDPNSRLPIYAYPTWPGVRELTQDGFPVTWITTLGRDGYWPVAVLGDHAPGGVKHSMSLVAVTSPEGGIVEHTDRMPLALKVCLAFAILILVGHTYGLSGANVFTSDDLYHAFRNSSTSFTQIVLRGLCAALSALPFLELLTIHWLGNPKGWIWLYVWTVIICLLVCFAFLYRVRGERTFPMESKDRRRWHRERQWAKLVSFCFFVMFLLAGTYGMRSTLHGAAADPFRLYALTYRMAHLTDGVSPLLPVLFLTLGWYFWACQAMSGNLMLDDGAPILPLCAEEELRTPLVASISNRSFLQWLFADWRSSAVAHHYGSLRKLFRRTSNKDRPGEGWQHVSSQYFRLSNGLGGVIQDVASPHYLLTTIPFVGGFLFLVLSLHWVGDPSRVTSLEGLFFSKWVTVAAATASTLALLGCLHLYATWAQLRRLLLALGRSRLRRAVKKLRPISSNSLWTASRNAHRVQYRLFYQQLEALRRLSEVYGVDGSEGCVALAVKKGREVQEFTRMSLTGSGRVWGAPLLADGRNIRHIFSDAAADSLNLLSETAWKYDKIPLYRAEGLNDCSQEIEERATDISAIIEAREEFLVAFYTAFAHNIIARMRTITMGVILLFVSVCFAVSMYPFTPRTYISSLLLLVFLMIGATVAYVYAEMDRNDWLESIADPKRGRLGSEYWLKMAGFLAGPVIGLLATQYPAIFDWFLSWLGPGMQLVK